MLINVATVAHCQENFLQCRDRDAITGHSKLLPLDVKLVEKVLELGRVFDWDLESDFTGYLTQFMHFFT